MAINEEQPIEDKELTIPLLKIPPFLPRVPADDMDDWERRDKKLVLISYVIAEKADFSVDAVTMQNIQLRELERQIVGFRKWKTTFMVKLGFISGTVVFVVTTVSGGILGKLANVIGDHLFGK